MLILDEPTNDFDVETLSALEDLLDGFAGTLLVISHDRYFLERVCDDFVGLVGDLHLRELTGGVEDYLTRLRARDNQPRGAQSNAQAQTADAPRTSAAQDRLAQKELAKLERLVVRCDERITRLHADLAEHATDAARVSTLAAELQSVEAERAQAEEAWLALAE